MSLKLPDSDALAKEAAFLDGVVETYVTSASPQDRAIKQLGMRAFAPFVGAQARALEMGCADGYFTSLIAGHSAQVSVVDGSTRQIARAKANLDAMQVGNVTFHKALFETFEPPFAFDAIFACYILEHVMDPVGVLQAARGWLKPGGVVCMIVPNARAQSRQLAQHMGLITDLYALTANDVHHGHRRVYDRKSFSADIAAAGLSEIAQGGLMLKPFADFQMDKLFETGVIGPAQLDGLYRMGLEYPDLAGSMWSVARAA